MVADSTFLLQKGQGWQRGFANLFAKENRAWWRTRRWLVQAILWPVVIDGLVVLMAFILPPATKAAGGGAMDPLVNGLRAVFEIGAMALAVGIVLLAHDQIIGERQSGVTEWILSKPASRPAYILSKLAADVVAAIVLLIAVPTAIAYGLISAVAGGPLPLGPYMLAVAGLALYTFFYLSLTLMMGVITTSRGALLGVPLVLLFAGLFLGGLMGTAVLFTPWGLPTALLGTALGVALPVPLLAPMAVTGALVVIFVAVTLWKFKHLEF